jgi:ankyrin repeat protein
MSVHLAGLDSTEPMRVISRLELFPAELHLMIAECLQTKELGRFVCVSKLIRNRLQLELNRRPLTEGIRGLPALCGALEGEYEHLIEVLLQLGVDINERFMFRCGSDSVEHSTALHIAYQDAPMVQRLLLAGADPEIRQGSYDEDTPDEDDYHGNGPTVLHLAASAEQLDTVKVLYNHGANLEADKYMSQRASDGSILVVGERALHIACQHIDTSVLQALLT